MPVQALFDEILRRFKGDDLREVYPSFDAVPVSRKSDALFTVIQPESVQLDAPFPDGSSGAFPFSAVYLVSVLIPMTVPLSRAEDFFYDAALPRMESLGSVLCEVRPAHMDVKLGRVVMEGRFRLRGVFLGEEAAACTM